MKLLKILKNFNLIKIGGNYIHKNKGSNFFLFLLKKKKKKKKKKRKKRKEKKFINIKKKLK